MDEKNTMSPKQHVSPNQQLWRYWRGLWGGISTFC